MGYGSVGSEAQPSIASHIVKRGKDDWISLGNNPPYRRVRRSVVDVANDRMLLDNNLFPRAIFETDGSITSQVTDSYTGSTQSFGLFDMHLFNGEIFIVGRFNIEQPDEGIAVWRNGEWQLPGNRFDKAMWILREIPNGIALPI